MQMTIKDKLLEQKALILLFLTFPLAGCKWEDQWGTINNMLGHIAKSYPAVERMLVALCYVIGIWLMATAFFKLKRYGETRTMMSSQIRVSGVFVYFLVGIVLFYFPSVVRIFLQTIWGTTSVLKYPVTPPKWKYFTDPVIGLVRIVGYIAFIRGWLLLVRLGSEGGSQPGTVGKALLHIFGGILAINVVGTLNMLGATID